MLVRGVPASAALYGHLRRLLWLRAAVPLAMPRPTSLHSATPVTVRPDLRERTIRRVKGRPKVGSGAQRDIVEQWTAETVSRQRGSRTA